MKNSQGLTSENNSKIYKLQNKNAGFLELIVVIIIALVLLNVLGIDINEILARPWVREFGTYIMSMLRLVWEDILAIFVFIKDLAA